MITLSSDYYSNFREHKCDPNTPDIEFALLCEGAIDEQLHFATSLDCCNYRNSDFYPLTRDIDVKAHDFITGSHDKYRRQGYFTAPFLVRCVLRGHDGNCLHVSEPEVMTAGLLPPVLELLRYDDFNGCDMHFRLCGIPVFRLMMRIGQLPVRLAPGVKNVDIYVSPQIPACILGGGRNCVYSDVLRSIDAAAGLHGKIDVRGRIRMMIGWYATSGNKFKRHYSDPTLSDKKVWYVAPNNHLVDMLAGVDGFYHVARIGAAGINAFSSFHTIDISSTLNQWIESQDSLDATETGTPARDKPSPRASNRPDRDKERPSAAIPTMSVTDSDIACAGQKNFYFLIFIPSLLPDFSSGLSPPTRA